MLNVWLSNSKHNYLYNSYYLPNCALKLKYRYAFFYIFAVLLIIYIFYYFGIDHVEINNDIYTKMLSMPDKNTIYRWISNHIVLITRKRIILNEGLVAENKWNLQMYGCILFFDSDLCTIWENRLWDHTLQLEYQVT